jgi:predicted secreted protein
MVGAGGMSRWEYVVISEGDFRMCKDRARLDARRIWTIFS